MHDSDSLILAKELHVDSGAADKSNQVDKASELMHLERATGVSSMQMLGVVGLIFGALVFYLRIVRPQMTAETEKHYPV